VFLITFSTGVQICEKLLSSGSICFEGPNRAP
jgi:hypothetical protein